MIDSGGYRTTFRFVNLSETSSSSVTLKLFTSGGSAWNILPGNQSQFTANIAPSGSASVQTTGNQSQASVGWAVVVNDGLIGTPELIQAFNGAGQATAEFGQTPFPRLRKFRVFARYDPSANVNTGIAFANPNSSSVVVNLSLYNESGALVATRNGVNVAAGRQNAQNLNQWFPGIGATTGTVVGTATNPGISVTIFQTDTIETVNLPVIF